MLLLASCFTQSLHSNVATRKSYCSADASRERLPFKQEGYNFWKWDDHKIHYVVKGEGQPIVLIHGFGASSFHWRYNILELAKYYQVYAMDLLGFGLSDKALVDYEPLLWSKQVAAFLKQVVARRQPAILIGNSIGGFTVLQTAAIQPELVAGLVLVNAAGRFEDEIASSSQESNVLVNVWKQIVDWGSRAIITFIFRQLKQQIKPALDSVYIDKTNVDANLIESIIQPAQHPDAEEVFYRMIYRFLFQPSNVSLDKLLQQLHCPLLLVWGDSDPLASFKRAERMKQIYGAATVVKLTSTGHCPHDETPERVNIVIIEWIRQMTNGEEQMTKV